MANCRKYCVKDMMNCASHQACQEYLERFLSKLQGTLGEDLISVALFGSMARGTVTPDSDIDLLIMVRGDRIINFKKYIQVKMDIEGDYPPYFSSIFTTQERLRKNPLILLDVLYEGKILHDPLNVLKSYLEKLSTKLSELGAERKQLDEKTWLWDLKPDWEPGEVVRIEL